MLLPQRNFYIQAITRLPSRRSKRITVARQSRNLTSLPFVTLVAVVLFYKLTQSISQKIHGFNTFFHYKIATIFYHAGNIDKSTFRSACSAWQA